MKTKTTIAPADCNEGNICKIARTVKDVGDFSLFTDSFTVWISESKGSDRPEYRAQHLGIPRDTFNRLIRWYLKPQKVR